MIGPATTSSHNALGVVAYSSLISTKPRYEINDRVKQNPDRRHPVPVNGDRHDIHAVLHVELAREDPDREQYRFSRQHEQMQHLHAEHEPHDRSVSIAVPATL